MSGQPTRRRIVLEILVFAGLFLIVGAAIVTLRVAREGPRVLNVDPHINR